MPLNRYGQQQRSVPFSSTAATMPAAQAFLVCPMVLFQACVGQASPLLVVYQRAFECAQAVVQPSLLERLETPTVN